MSFPVAYNPLDANDILRYAKWLIGKTFYDVIEEDIKDSRKSPLVSGYQPQEFEPGLLMDSAVEYGNAKRKGGLGNLIEERFFHYDSNSNPEADFAKAGLELKLSPYEERRGNGKKKTSYVAGERLVLSMIDYNQRPIQFDLLQSHLWEKCSKILLIYYMRDKSLADNLKYRINYVGIFTPNNRDMVIIKQDYYYLMKRISRGEAHEISEGDTMYLGACTKGSTAEKSVVIQIENGIKAKKRAFCYKNSYMTTVLNEYFINAPDGQESVISDEEQLSELGFDGYVQHEVNRYVGKTDEELCRLFDIKYNNNKSQWIKIAFALLGVKSNKAEEFMKANIVVKATRIEENGKIKENTSFPPFKFKEFVEESWIDYTDEGDDEDSIETSSPNANPSTVQSYFASTKFLFVVFKKKGDKYVLKGCQLWNMPYNDLNITVRQGWESIQRTIIEGVEFIKKQVKSGKRKGLYTIENNLPKISDNPIIHIRPHANKAYYKIGGYESGNKSDGNELPNGDWMTTQCFWLNNTYVKSILRDDLK